MKYIIFPVVLLLLVSCSKSSAPVVEGNYRLHSSADFNKFSLMEILPLREGIWNVIPKKDGLATDQLFIVQSGNDLILVDDPLKPTIKIPVVIEGNQLKFTFDNQALIFTK